MTQSDSAKIVESTSVEQANGEETSNKNIQTEETLNQQTNTEADTSKENNEANPEEIKEETFETAKDSTGGKFDTMTLVQEVAKLAMAKGYRFTPRLHITLFGNAWGT